MSNGQPQFWGATPLSDTDWSFAVWSPDATVAHVILDGRQMPMDKAADGTFRLTLRAAAGMAYRFSIDGQTVPDPAARQQQETVHGPSLLTRMLASGDRWTGRDWRDSVIAEVHIGTFTTEGTFAAAAGRLANLVALGINTVEVMPIAQFAGAHGWGYDGVLHYAPHPSYGTPDDFVNFIKVAHDLGLSVILDVVYNHFGPEGAYLGEICPAFFDANRATPWGPAIDFTRAPVREFFIQNAIMWIRDYGVDGLRLDAVHQLQDPSTPEFLAELAKRLRALDLPRPLHLIAEDERNLSHHRDAGLTDAQWNDDYHHSLHCLLTGEAEGYYAPFSVDPIGDLAIALTDGHVAQGQSRQDDPHDGPPRGAPSAHLPPDAFVNANQTHDQIGNRALGERLIALAGPEAMRVAHALLLTAPFVPMLFQGEEVGARTPFPFFCDFQGDLADIVRKGRLAEFSSFTGFGGDLPDPLDPATFASARPYNTLPEDADDWRNLTARLLAWRCTQVLPLLHSGQTGASSHVIGSKALAVTWSFGAGKLHSVVQLGQAVPPDLWPIDGAGLQLGAPTNDFAFCTWVTQPKFH
ncbi:malto-oligosyltrehalose trehalohydrolase [Loktanella sp. M215]|uniref:malto-oligosyltrehalose trehalohydrolase n=1 Tax=Loktanella sp. M215 TaxID=2675431 RepID=UPI001F00A678|nr:malto-oligosyltrehalose trehalohydrolase [Loktanella sp. M215]MCF7701754.1 malto-oligosyltrehalose trehalohydrolase [Loktanella sp. M215]